MKERKRVMKLTTDEVYEFHLVGIVSTLPDYSIATRINKTFGIQFKREESDYQFFYEKRQANLSVSYFRCFAQFTGNWKLVTNHAEGGILIPEQNNMDYFLLLDTRMSDTDFKDVISRLSSIEDVNAAVVINHQKLKSKKNLLSLNE